MDTQFTIGFCKCALCEANRSRNVPRIPLLMSPFKASFEIRSSSVASPESAEVANLNPKVYRYCCFEFRFWLNEVISTIQSYDTVYSGNAISFIEVARSCSGFKLFYRIHMMIR